MRLFKNICRLLPTILIVAVVMLSCTRNEDAFIPDIKTDGIVCQLSLPAVTVVETRSVGTVVENRISDITILIFNASTKKFIQKVSGNGLQSSGTNNNVWKFIVDIPNGTYDLVALANTSQFNLESIGTTMDKTAVSKMLYMTSDTRWSATSSIPMWGELTNYTVTSTSKPKFEMTRMLARINVNGSAVPAATFAMTNIYYYNYTTKGYIIPESGKYNTITKKVTAPSYTSSLAEKTGYSLSYSGTDISSNKCENKIYVFEATSKGNVPAPGQNWNPNATSWKNNPCLVIGGRYGGSGSDVTYYRVDFIDKTENANACLNILRNYSYNVVISKVSGPGYSSASIAMQSAPMNMVVATYPVNDPDAAMEAVEGPYFMTLTQSQIAFSNNNQNTAQRIVLKTNYLVANWSAATYSNEACTTPITDGWIKLNPSSGAGSLTGSNINITLSNNSVRTGYVKFTVGRMSLVLKVSYSNT